MPKYQPSPELAATLADPIEFDLCGKHFTIPKITNRMLGAFAALGDKPDSLAVLEVFIGDEVREMDPDIREVFPLIEWLSSMVTSGLGGEEKNAPEPLPESPSPSLDYLDTVN